MLGTTASIVTTSGAFLDFACCILRPAVVTVVSALDCFVVGLEGLVMVERIGCTSDTFGCRHNVELVVSAALLLRNVNQNDPDVGLELKAIIRRLDELSAIVANSGLSAGSVKIAA